MKRLLVMLTACFLLAALVPGAQHAATTPPVPTGVTGIALTGSVQLAWQPVSGASGYTVYRGTSAGSITTALTGVGAITGTTYADNTAQNGITYYYAVRAVESGVQSSNSLAVQSKPVGRSCSSGNAVVLENCYPGNTPWNVRNPDTVADGGIEGYATAQSIDKGDSLPIKVNSANDTTFNIEIYRSGYYGGAGARLFSVIQNVPGVAQPACMSDPTTGLLDCSNWSVSATISTTASWPSGIYLLRIVRNDDGSDNQIIFVVRDDSSHSALLYGTAMSTFEAYNNYGGKSLYTFNSTGAQTVSGTPRAVKVSYDRPFEQPRTMQNDWYTNDEFATVYWLEEMGYDVSYISNTDLETSGSLLLNHKAYISPAHDEYISAAMRSAMTNARDAGVNLFFTGANEDYWKIRFENSPTTGAPMRTEVCYKTVESGGPDPSGISTSSWRDPNGPNQPENALSGEMYIGDSDWTFFPLVVNATEGTDRIYRYTPVATQTPGSQMTIGGELVGWEWDARVNNGSEPAGVKTLSSSPVTGELVQGSGASYTQNQDATSSMVKYTAPSGALVVATGTNQWNRGLALNAFGMGEPDTIIEQVTTNILEDMGAVPQTPDPDITLDSPANRPPAPVGLTATPAGSDSVNLSWQPVTGASGYNVYRSLAPRQGGEPLGFLANTSTIVGTSFTDTDLDPSTDYYYVVTAVVSGTESLASAEVEATTTMLAPSVTQTSPSGGASDVPITSTVGASFSEAMSASTITTSTFTLTAPGNVAVPATVTYDSSTQTATLTPTHSLQFGTSYTAKVTTGVKSADGMALAAPVTWTFTMHQPHAPSVTSTFPANAATGVSPAVVVRASFDQALDPSTVTSASFTLTGPGGAVPAVVAYDASSQTATLTPQHALALSSSYTATLSSTISGLDGGLGLPGSDSWSFTTAATAPAAPTTVTVPANGATAVPIGTSVKITFSRDMYAPSLTASSVTLAAGSSPVEGTVSYDAPSRTLTFAPTAPLAASTTYTATLAATVTAADGTPLGSPVSSSFTTVEAPSATSVSPSAGATYVGLSTPVTVSFSRAMDPTTLTASSFTISAPASPPAPATVSYDATSQTATLTPTSPLEGGTEYTASLDTTVKAADGTPLAQAVTWTFTTAACPCSVLPSSLQPTATGLPTQDGRSGAGPFTYELGMKFTVDEPMQLTAFRFYKSPGETGTHIGKLWSSTGSLLASQTFATETASGWQMQSLATPVTLQPGSVYTISVNANSFFVSTIGGLATQLVAGPVHSVADGANGVFNGSAGLFPTDSYVSSNYFVDGVFVPNGDPGPLGVVSTTPAANATSVSTTAPISVQFSRTVDPSTLTSSSFQVSDASGPVAGTIDYSDANDTATFTPTSSLAYSTSYTVNLTTAIHARDGKPLGAATQWSFTTVDQARPTVVRTVPTNGATDAPQSVAVSAVFSEDMDPTTLTSSAFTLTGPGGAVAGTVTYASATDTATFTPTAALTAGATYTAKLAASVAATDASTLGTAYSWSFTVASTALPPPSVTSTSPTNGATLVAQTPTITAVVSRSLDPTTVTSSTVTLAAGSTTVPATVSYDDPTKTIMITPNAQLLGATTYTATITTGVKAIDGTSFTSAYSWSFTTAACPCSLFSTTLVPATVSNSTVDGRTGAGPFTYELGVKLTVDQTMQLTAIRFYKSPGETGTHIGRVWTSGGLQLAQVTFTGETASGWQVQSLASPLTLQPGSVYVISVNANQDFVATNGGLLSQVNSGPLHSVADGANGVFAGAAGTFPTQSYGSSNYFVDVVASPGVATPAPTVTSTSPVNGATGVATTGAVTATFSRGMDSTSLTSSTVTLTGPGGPVSGTVTYDSTTDTVTLTPSSTLAFDSVYTVRIDGSVLASDGTALGSAYSWSFTTTPAVAPQVTHTVPADGDANVNKGVVVKADFSKPLNASTVTSTTVKLTGPSGTVAGTVSYDSSLQEVSLTPSAALAPGSYTATLAGSIAATDGTTLGTAYTWSFTVPSVPVPLTVAPGSPTAGATGVARDTTVTAVFSRDVTASTITASTFTLTDPNNAPVTATVSYDPSSHTATLTPSSALAESTVYTVKLASTIHSDDGTALGGTTSWQFTTGACPCSVFAASSTPSLTGLPAQDGRSGAGPWSYELGMKFTVDSAVKLTAIRFYKDVGETGTHTGTLWSSDGTKLATVTFANETASGWQQANLSTPVQLQAGTTYVVSYNTNAFFVDTPGGLASAQGTGPLHTVVGTNGVFGAAAGTFPTSSFNSSNYWVDVVVE